MANKGLCGKRWPEIRAAFEQCAGPLGGDDVAVTRGRNHAIALASEAARAGYRRLVSIGGDGTFGEVLNGVIEDDRPIAPDLVLAQIPAGTSNEICRSFAGGSLSQACRAVVSGRTRPIDVFRVEAESDAGASVTRYGCILAIAGGPATISWRAQKTPLLKRIGPLSYVIVAAVTSLTYVPRLLHVRIDEEAEQSLPLWGLMLCNFPGAGEKLLLAPDADPGDGKLDLVLLGNFGRWDCLTRVVPKLGDGSYLSHPKIALRRVNRLELRCDRPVRADVDGETIGHLPMSVSLLPFQMQVAAS
jgi:diacylglycerol kinase (ATP)